MAISAADFRVGMRQLAAAVNVITTAGQGVRAGMTATAVMSLTAEPPQLGIMVNRGNSSYAALDSAGVFAVNVLSQDQASIAHRFAGADGVRGEERFAAGEWTTLATGAPVLGDCAANFDCRVVSRVDFSSHVMFVGEIQAIRTKTDVVPLLFMNGAWASLVRASDFDFRAYETVVDKIEGAMKSVLASGGTPAEQLQEFCLRFTDISSGSIDVLREFFSRETVAPASRLDEINRRKRAVESELRGLLDRGVSSGQFEVMDAGVAADAIIGMMNSIHRWPGKGDRAPTTAVGTHFSALVASMVTSRRVAP